MKFIKFLSLNLILYSSLLCAKEIGKYKMIEIEEYSKSLAHEEIGVYDQEGLVVICDINGKIANFDGVKIGENIYSCEEADVLFQLMSIEDKQKTYLRKFNGDLQFWTVDLNLRL